MAKQKDHIGEVNKMMTAVEWFAEVTAQLGYVSFNAFDKAKQMEKEQIMDSFSSGAWYENQDIHKTSEQYYNETYAK